MYSNYRSVQILISLLKQYDIKDIVLSPGGSDIPLIHSIETDDFFNCYSVVDERSAAYFALGISITKNKIAACICTSGSAVCNYLPGITEAFYQSAPVLAITADKNPYFQGQLETQKIEQSNIFNGVVKKSVNLPLVNSGEDEWLCNRLVNEALLSLNHHGSGPAHINIPIVGSYNDYSCKSLPQERKITLLGPSFNDEIWKNVATRVSSYNRILVVVGQNLDFTESDIVNCNVFFEKYNCVFAVEHLSNLCCNGTVETYPVSETVGSSALNKLIPDLVISLGNNLSAYNLKPVLRGHYREISNWLISESGEVRDAYKCLTDIIECSVHDFFEYICKFAPANIHNNMMYYNLWQEELSKIHPVDEDFTNFYVAQELAKVIPENSILHTAILNSTRVMQFFPLANGVRTFSNVGTLGIDGCYSTFAGAAASTDKLAFLLIGDLSFFYDMNAAGLRSIGSNVRVILLNNGGGSEFHFFMGKEKIPTINSYICAEHNKTAEGWIRSLGYNYYSARTKEELNCAIGKFGETSDKPMFLEVFTSMEYDADHAKKYYQSNVGTLSSGNIKNVVRSVIPEHQIEKVKKILNILKS